MSFAFHRKDQLDLQCKPLICVHLKKTGTSRRIFCLWLFGLQVGKWYCPAIRQ